MFGVSKRFGANGHFSRLRQVNFVAWKFAIDTKQDHGSRGDKRVAAFQVFLPGTVIKLSVDVCIKSDVADPGVPFWCIGA